MRTLALLILLSTAAAAAAESQAIRCIRKFTDLYEHAGGYKTRLRKTEFDFQKQPLVENLEIEESGKSALTLTFVDEGRSGIKNNGMKVRYKSGDEVSIELGRSRGAGLLLNGLAEVFVSKRKKLFDSDVLDKQVFTINRAGFGYFARTLAKRLPDLEAGKLGKLEAAGPDCKVSYRADRGNWSTVEVHPKESVFDLEDKYGTLAYLIYKANSGLFHDFGDLFRRRKIQKLEISPSFTDFNLELENDGSPRLVEIFWKDKPVGRYEFSQTVFN